MDNTVTRLMKTGLVSFAKRHGHYTTVQLSVMTNLSETCVNRHVHNADVQGAIADLL